MFITLRFSRLMLKYFNLINKFTQMNCLNNVEGEKGRGKPKKRWLDTILENDTRAADLCVRDVENKPGIRGATYPGPMNIRGPFFCYLKFQVYDLF